MHRPEVRPFPTEVSFGTTQMKLKLSSKQKILIWENRLANVWKNKLGIELKIFLFYKIL